jgi:phenylpyruvate tautomerase PptA (4-oxalocrotonate tautomerase family)
MPCVSIYESEGANEIQKAGLVKDTTLAMVKHLSILEDSVRMVFCELREDEIAIGVWLLSSPEYEAMAKRAGLTELA